MAYSSPGMISVVFTRLMNMKSAPNWTTMNTTANISLERTVQMAPITAGANTSMTNETRRSLEIVLCLRRNENIYSG